MNKKSIWALSIGALVAFITAIAHLSCIFYGPACYQAQLAPQAIVQSAIDGTLLAPVGTIIISLLFIACGLFALSGAGFIKKLPLLHLALSTIAGLCILRGISTIPASYVFPELVSSVSIISGATWFVTGLLFAYGYLSIKGSSAA